MAATVHEDDFFDSPEFAVRGRGAGEQEIEESVLEAVGIGAFDFIPGLVSFII